jgi:hypothetical protein
MCRNIKVLRGYEPPATDEEIHAAALQYVRKVSGFRAPSAANQAAFDAAVEAISEATHALLEALEVPGGKVRTREEEARRARERGQAREARLRKKLLEELG